MAVCPFATWTSISGAVGSYRSGPYRIAHHTTEGRRAADAIATYRRKANDPHFTVDDLTI